MDIRALLTSRFENFNRDTVSVGPGVMTNASNLPGDFHPGLAARDPERVVANSLRNVEIWPGGPDCCELIAEILVEALEPVRKSYCRLAVSVQRDDAVVDVHHVG